MSERLREDEESRAQRFAELHVHIPTDYETYCRETVEQWRKDLETAQETGEQIRPMWLRRNGDSGSEFSAHIDYLIPTERGIRHLAAIDVADNDVQAWLPKEEGSKDLMIATSEPYDLESLGRAIELVETTVVAPRS